MQTFPPECPYPVLVGWPPKGWVFAYFATLVSHGLPKGIRRAGRGPKSWAWPGPVKLPPYLQLCKCTCVGNN